MTRRDWSRANIKRSTYCRVCGQSGRVELAHTIGRAHDDREGKAFVVRPDSVVPLCELCHRSYDAGTLDLRGFLTLEEELDAVRSAGGLEAATRRLMGSRAYRSAA